ncbi:ADP-ribosylglycohydrolase [Salinigranum rubrum]|uniref:ADP-ribosylglycohydrolase n=1 Tax=Salinigranum rubrum TaxID=755307 RepID=A0A2I8VLZ4_9EURY|nr:ADP-ribosylglycohydrolase family protein [Salinigranum rubrum]AUV82952.1 ADP-ribosylglycohydrolase [Salinigranum rubrum]
METDRTAGVLLGLACGDALGRPVEFETPARILAQYGEVREMLANGTWGKPAGTVTDDTDMAVCLARSLVSCGGFDPDDVAERFVAWYDAEPFDVGNMTARALSRIRDGDSWETAGQRVWEESPEGSNAGNGSVMRAPPLAVAFADDESQLADASETSSRITHADPRCTAGCAVLNLTLAGLLLDREDPLAGALDRVGPPSALDDALRPVVAGDLDPSTLRSTGYVVDTLQTALWHGLHADSPEAALVEVVNMGGDADTVGAVAGAVVGARFGADALPERWLAELDDREELRDMATRLSTL